MEVRVPPLRHSKIVRLKKDHHANELDLRRAREEEVELRRRLKVFTPTGYRKNLAITLKEGKVRGDSGGKTAGISDGCDVLGSGCYRASPTNKEFR
jgi:hypothetical protein